MVVAHDAFLDVDVEAYAGYGEGYGVGGGQVGEAAARDFEGAVGGDAEFDARGGVGVGVELSAGKRCFGLTASGWLHDEAYQQGGHYEEAYKKFGGVQESVHIGVRSG